MEEKTKNTKFGGQNPPTEKEAGESDENQLSDDGSAPFIISDNINPSFYSNFIVIRIANILFALLLLLLIYFFIPAGDIVNYLSQDTPSVIRQSAIYSVIQKIFFLGIATFLLFQLRRLLLDVYDRAQQVYFPSRFREKSLSSEIARAFKSAAETKLDIQSPKIEISLPQIEEQIEEQIEGPDGSKPSIPDAYKVFRNFRARMRSEVARLNSISTRNLSIGIVFSLTALFFIAYPLVFAAAVQESSITVQQQQNANAIDWLARYYLPRLGVGLLLQFVGFFFLRLYVANEQDIKYSSNEITNLEAKMMAILVAGQRNDKALFKPLLESLAKTERNFVLKKNERSIHDEDRQYNDLLHALESFGSFWREREKKERKKED